MMNWRFFVAHYIDDYTFNDVWARDAAGGLNDVDRRSEKNRNNPNYQKINDDITEILRPTPSFSGMDGFSAMAAVSHAVEKKLSELIAQRSDRRIEFLDLPAAIDAEVRRRITL